MRMTVSQELERTTCSTNLTSINHGATCLLAPAGYFVLTSSSQTFALGQRADVILANAKRKLNVGSRRLAQGPRRPLADGVYS